jgi:hypothetical protein
MKNQGFSQIKLWDISRAQELGNFKNPKGFQEILP